MKHKLFSLIACVFCAAQIQAQTITAMISDKGSYKKNFTEGLLLLEEGNEHIAHEYFKFAYKYDSTTANINYYVGSLYLHHQTQKHLAEKYLEKAVLDVTKNYDETNVFEKRAPNRAFLALGKAYHLDYKFDEAVKMYDTYESYIPLRNKKAIEEIEHLKKQIFYAKEYVAAPHQVTIINMGDSINTEYPEYSPTVSADEKEIYFTYRGTKCLGFPETNFDGFPFEDIMISYKIDDTYPGIWTKPVSVSPNINSFSHEGICNMTPDGQNMVIYKGDQDGENLYYSTYEGSDWSLPTKFGSNINTDYWEPGACLSRDGNTLYFASDRPGGLGGIDLYKAVKLPNGSWSLAQNLGPKINTQWDEDSPFIAPDGITFFFSSQGHNSMGGLDIMFSIIDNNGEFSDPVNLGYPINTTDDDVDYITSPDHKRAYYSSAHEDPKAKGEKDLYMISMNLPVTHPMILFKGQIIGAKDSTLPDDMLVVVTNKKNGEVVGSYRPHKRNGTFATILDPGIYNFSYQMHGKEFYNEDVIGTAEVVYQEIQRAINLNPVNIADATNTNTTVEPSGDNIKLNVLVLNNKKENLPVANAQVNVISKGEKDLILNTDANGKVSDIPLAVKKSYSLSAKEGKFSSYKTNISTFGVKPGSVIEKTLYLNSIPGGTIVPDNSEVSGTKFKFTFKYNMNEVDETAPEFTQFIENLVASANTNGIKIKLFASASQVPTKFEGGNTGLANKRLKTTKEKITKALLARGIAADQIKFISVYSKVQGPAYAGDANNTEKYEKYQYVEAKAN